jgi:hypothetical protein
MAETTMDELVLWTNWYYGRNNYGRNGTMAETTMDEMVLWSKRLWTKQLRTNWYHGRNGTMDETTMDETTMDEMVLWTNWYYGRNDYGRNGTMAETTMDEMVLWTKRLVPICITVLIPSHFCASPKSGPGFPTSYIVVFVCVQWVKVRGDLFVDIGGIVHHHCFKFLFIITISSNTNILHYPPKSRVWTNYNIRTRNDIILNCISNHRLNIF